MELDPVGARTRVLSCEFMCTLTTNDAVRDGDVRVVVLGIHGLNSHARHPNARALAGALATREVACVMFDLPGHGACREKRREKRGVFDGKVMTSMRAKEALIEGLRAIGKTRTEVEIVICGSSLGGALAIYVANEFGANKDFDIARVVLINPLMKMKMPISRAAKAAFGLAARIAPRFVVGGRPTDRSSASDDGPDIDLDAEAQCDQDELAWKSGVTLRTACELYDLVDGNAETNALVNLSFRVPVLVILGGRDEVVPMGEAIDKSKLAVGAGGKVEVKIFEKAGHSLTMQSRAKREEFFDLVARWRWE